MIFKGKMRKMYLCEAGIKSTWGQWNSCRDSDSYFICIHLYLYQHIFQHLPHSIIQEQQKLLDVYGENEENV